MTITTTVQNPEHFLRIVGDITKASRIYRGSNGIERLHVRPWYPSDVRAVAAAAYRQNLSAVIRGHTVVVSGFEQQQRGVVYLDEPITERARLNRACDSLGLKLVTKP